MAYNRFLSIQIEGQTTKDIVKGCDAVAAMIERKVDERNAEAPDKSGRYWYKVSDTAPMIVYGGIEDTVNEIKKLKNNIDELKKNVSSMKAENEKLKKELSESTNEPDPELKNKFFDLQIKYDTLMKENEELKKQADSHPKEPKSFDEENKKSTPKRNKDLYSDLY